MRSMKQGVMFQLALTGKDLTETSFYVSGNWQRLTPG